MSNLFIGIGALCALIAVAAGAFGAHGLKQILSPDMLATYHTAAEYQFMHSIGLIAIGTLHKVSARRSHLSSAWTMLAGIITPIGGVCFIVAWLILAFSYLLSSRT